MLETALGYLKSIPWTSAASILFGASISALVSFLLQRSSFTEARLQKEKDRREVRNPNKVLVIAVSDGAGSASHAAFGAQIASCTFAKNTRPHGCAQSSSW
ncbi:MAG: protein phosphatase 2C domain-containing protein [Bradyrhizobium sp.]